MPNRRAGFFLLVLVVIPVASAPVAKAETPSPVRAVLDRHCAACHATAGKGKGGFDYLFDHARLIARGQVLPGRAEASPLWQRVASGEMPPAGKPALSEAEKTLLRDWLQTGAKDWAPAVVLTAMSAREVAERVRTDRDGLDPRRRPYLRYVSFAHLAPLAGAGPLLESHRHALVKLVNALSWSARLVPPTPIDPQRLIYRLDLRDYRWTSRTWDRLASLSPYPLEADLPLLRGDWFLATASRPPFYHDFLQLPSTEKGLERLLQVDAPTHLQEDRAFRAGFTNSGVARHNRVLERHDSVFGAYWRSYDFRDNLGRQNVFEAPLGPAGRGVGFQHDGGEMVYALPNGLHGYFISDAAGRRLDRAPVEVVSDPKRPDRAVEVGISCFSCHTQGYLPKDDMVRARVLRDAKTFTLEEREQILAWYPPAARLKALMDEDNVRYRKALAALGLPSGGDDPIETSVLRYEAVVDAETAAAEIGLSADVLVRHLAETEPLRRTLGALVAPRGNLPRIVWEEQYPILVRSLEARPALVERPVTGHTGAIRALVAGPANRLLSGGDDRLAMLWDALTLTPLRRLEGHTNEVSAVAFRNDREVLTASLDRTVRLWDMATGRELRRFTGATDRLRTLAVTPDGRHVFASGDDPVILGWEIATGRLVFRFEGHRDAVLALACDPASGTLASVGREGVVVRWELVRGTELARIESPATRPIRALAWSPDGGQILLAGEDREAYLLGRDGKLLWRSPRADNTLVATAFLGGHAVTMSSQYRTEGTLAEVRDGKSGDLVASLSGVGLGRIEVLAIEQREGQWQAVLAVGNKLRRIALPTKAAP